MNELMDFYDVSRIVAGTERWIRYVGGIGEPKWWRYSVIVTREGYYCGALIDDSKNVWFPGPEQQKEKAWEVEPEKPKEIIVFCACDKDGKSYIYSKEPKSGITCWLPDTAGGNGSWIGLHQKNLFPKDHYVKRNLILEGK